MIILLGVLGRVIVSMIGYLVMRLRDFHAIVIDILPNENKTLFRITNDGNVPVTNMILTIRTPTEIVEFSNYSSTPLSVRKIDSTIIRAQ